MGGMGMAGEKLECLSPDGKFAVHRKDSADGSETESEIVSLPERKQVQRLPSGTQGQILWSPDSKSLAYSWEEAPRITHLFIARAEGEIFNRIETLDTFPGGTLSYSGWPKGWKSLGGGRSYVSPRRWLSADTLEMEGLAYQKVARPADEELAMWEVRVHFSAKLGTKEGTAVISKPTIMRRDFEPAEDAKPPTEISKAVPETLRWTLAPDKAAALVSTKAGVKLAELKGKHAGRVTALEDEVTQLFAADFKPSHPAGENAAKPFTVVDLMGFSADWVFRSNNEIAIQCEATTNEDGEHYEGMWCARVEAVWNIANHKFTQQKVTRVTSEP